MTSLIRIVLGLVNPCRRGEEADEAEGEEQEAEEEEVVREERRVSGSVVGGNEARGGSVEKHRQKASVALPHQRQLLDLPLTLQELQEAVKSMARGKTPRDDGLLVEFYEATWEQVGPILLRIFNKVLEGGRLTEDMYRGTITLVYKKGDKQNVRNWRPISLLNVAYKILAEALSRRLAKVLPELVCADYGAFMKGRSIAENILVAMGALEVISKEKRQVMVAMLDLEKAYDRVNWSFVLATLEYMNFGAPFPSWIDAMYCHSTASMLVNRRQSQNFELSRSLKQGCLMTPLLFVLQMEVFLNSLQTTPLVKGLRLRDEVEPGMHAVPDQMDGDQRQAAANPFVGQGTADAAMRDHRLVLRTPVKQRRMNEDGDGQIMREEEEGDIDFFAITTSSASAATQGVTVQGPLPPPSNMQKAPLAAQPSSSQVGASMIRHQLVLLYFMLSPQGCKFMARRTDNGQLAIPAIAVSASPTTKEAIKGIATTFIADCFPFRLIPGLRIGRKTTATAAGGSWHFSIVMLDVKVGLDAAALLTTQGVVWLSSTWLASTATEELQDIYLTDDVNAKFVADFCNMLATDKQPHYADSC
ncbi:hypothetical protein CBR_g17752 [Chara braunii]|uniref:Reverse transcriptase domain-containing protein n=1 Tax=Chara braunii TaxID=69332 RepID=A0A388KVN9_CHABU|nr:hypothetical protein CBR_g17752 [Chara braunii]|eukprot:GBG74042.1 hypothetical protein CBR_g17752 [Chara braunii]